VQLLTFVAGAAVIVAIVWTVFQDLFHPSGSSALSDWIGRAMFKALRRRRRLLPFAGPLGVLAVIATWVMALVFGFALLYYGTYPTDFSTSTGASAPVTARVLNSVYFSFETLITLGYGDLVPATPVTKLLSAVEALIGFGLLTASVSMFVLLYPALARMRLLARTVSTATAAEQRLGIRIVDTGSDVVLAGLARDVVRTRIDLVHFPSIYYFAAADPQASVAYWMPQLVRWANDGSQPALPSHVRMAAASLDEALSDLARLLASRFIPIQSHEPLAVFRAFARDHAIDPA
jgi:hypothetical protein